MRTSRKYALPSLPTIAECHGRRLSRYHGDTAGFLRLIFFFRQFGHGVNAGEEVIHLNQAAVGCFHGFIHTVALDAEGNAVHLAVLRGLDDFGRAIRNLNVKIAFYGVAD